jgi:deoxyribodipyrimidine photolyase-related protein
VKALVLFPHQLYFDFPDSVDQNITIYLLEEHLFFRQYPFHKQKLIFHRASMKAYAEMLQNSGFTLVYVEALEEIADIRKLVPHLKQQGFDEIICFEPDDFLLTKRLKISAEQVGCTLNIYTNQLFINSIAELGLYQKDHKRLFQTDFYIHQRKKRNILLDELGGPLGGKWSFDADNRKKYPSSKTPPPSPSTSKTAFHNEAESYVEKHFAQNYGELKSEVHYPITPQDANIWLTQFFEQRFHEFGAYEDAIVTTESFLHHSVITPMLNVGILKPIQVIQAAIKFADGNQVDMNSLEGFVRQILGWREFVRYVYHFHSVEQRTRNFWGFERKIPKSFYDGTTGIRPVDDAIKKLNKTAYNHHIERLMVLSNFMLLCEFDPDEVYQWFMEMYIDAYDWVMVPNVYGMAQFADGGKMVTKPYISGSNYIFKMSDYKNGEPWADIWDALFWRFMSVNRDFFKSNPRLAMLINTFDKWDEDKKSIYLNRAEAFLESLNDQ